MTAATTDSRSAGLGANWRWLQRLRGAVVRRPGGLLAWRIGIAVLGLVVVAGGIVLLPLPGPGWVIIFLGLGIWATEFAWAGRLLAFARRQVAAWTRWVKRQPRWLQAIVALVSLAFLAGVLYLVWIVYQAL